ncbi:MAG: class I SAM-dependent methyltransferase [Methanoregula sp.]
MIDLNFIPGLRFPILTPLYDSFLRVVMDETRVKSRLVTQLDPIDNESILDFGCGTGTLTLMIKRAGPGCEVYGIDIDTDMLEIAERKARHDEVDIHLILYDGLTLPFADGTFDKVVSSLMVHHLSREDKPRLFGEVYRVLKKGGELHILDFGIQRSLYAKLLSFFLKFLEPIEENILGMIPEYLKRSGFKDGEEVHYEQTPIGTLSFYRAKKS